MIFLKNKNLNADNKIELLIADEIEFEWIEKIQLLLEIIRISVSCVSLGNKKGASIQKHPFEISFL